MLRMFHDPESIKTRRFIKTFAIYEKKLNRAIDLHLNEYLKTLFATLKSEYNVENFASSEDLTRAIGTNKHDILANRETYYRSYEIVELLIDNGAPITADHLLLAIKIENASIVSTIRDGILKAGGKITEEHLLRAKATGNELVIMLIQEGLNGQTACITHRQKHNFHEPHPFLEPKHRRV